MKAPGPPSGLDGICDRNALAAAVARPQSGYYEDVIQAGAAFMRKLAAESPVCGRQQTHGYHRYDRVLRLNGYEIRFVDRDLYDWLMQLYDTNNVNRSSLEV
jgi:death-on-curing protein